MTQGNEGGSSQDSGQDYQLPKIGQWVLGSH